MDKYYTLLLDPEYNQVLQFILACNLSYTIDESATRCEFMVPHGPISQRLYERFPEACVRVS